MAKVPCTYNYAIQNVVYLVAVNVCKAAGTGLPSSKCRSLAIIIASQHEPATDACTGHKRRQQTCRELHGLPVSASRNYLIDAASIVVKVLLCGDGEAEFKADHLQMLNQHLLLSLLNQL